MTIRLLPPTTVNRIAAGEVVERPASAVKELVENAIDAGAKRIAIHVELGGKKQVRVEDDGEGMDPDDARLALERHATSKIRRADDLAAILADDPMRQRRHELRDLYFDALAPGQSTQRFFTALQDAITAHSTDMARAQDLARRGTAPQLTPEG